MTWAMRNTYEKDYQLNKTHKESLCDKLTAAQLIKKFFIFYSAKD